MQQPTNAMAASLLNPISVLARASRNTNGGAGHGLMGSCSWLEDVAFADWLWFDD